MTEVIKDDIAPGPRNRKTERPIMNNGVPVLLLYDEENDRTVMSRGDIEGGMKVIGMMYDGGTGAYIPPHGAEQGGVNKVFTNTDTLESRIQELEEQLKILNMHMQKITDLEIEKMDVQ